MRTAVTVCLVPEARQGPFVLHDGLAAGCVAAAAAGYDGVEVFPPGAESLGGGEVRRLLAAHGLELAAVGTGAGWLVHQLHLCHADSSVRDRARRFIAEMIDAAGELGAPAIIGSMQGRSSPGVSREAALGHLADALHDLASRAARHGQSLLYEPLNRYETDLFNHQAEAAAFLDTRGLHGVRLLCDLFHMNIEEADVAATLVACGRRVGHVHWADSNRRAMGLGHTAAGPVIAALEAIGYEGWLSAEVFPLPSAAVALRQTIASIRPAG